MSLSDELLGLAGKLIDPAEANELDARSRRAISTAYYAVFHLLIEHGAASLVGHPGLRQLVARAYAHGDMLKASRAFRSGAKGLPGLLALPFGPQIPAVPLEITQVAVAFEKLQDARHDADYNLSRQFDRAEAQVFVDTARTAFADWNAVVANPAHTDMVELFLAALLLGERWRR